MNHRHSNINLEAAPDFVLHHYSYLSSSSASNLLHDAYGLIRAVTSQSGWDELTHLAASSKSPGASARCVQYPPVTPPLFEKEDIRCDKEWGLPIGDDDDVFLLDDLEDFRSTDFNSIFAEAPRVAETSATRPHHSPENWDRHDLHDVIPQPHIHPSSCITSAKPHKYHPWTKTRPIPILPHTSPFSPPPYARSAWLVPIRGAFSWDRCTPAVMLGPAHLIPACPNSSTGDPIVWTHTSVRSFWSFLLDIQRNGSAGAIGLSFHASRNGAAISQVVDTVSSTYAVAGGQQQGFSHNIAIGAQSIATTAGPPRPVLSNVDYIKIYHDAVNAMHLRTILYVWSHAVQADNTEHAPEKIRVLKGAKLVLVDERSRGILIA